ncbi:MAG: sugar-binding transcriptional regulator [Opitutaceae bacterium]|nr:sugar-binding transcriptional regulator [Opitutaceae bacterium]
MPNSYSDQKLRLAARLYYVDGLAQNEVAKFVKVSQAKVSRLLALARERGIVRITVADYDSRNADLERQLRRQFQLSTAIVIRSEDTDATAGLRRVVGHFAAAAVNELIKPRTIVALAGGRTIHAVVRHLPEPRNKALTIVQAMGSVDFNVSEFDAQEIGREMAQRLGGTFLALNTPAFFPEKKTRDALLKLPQVRGVLQHLDQAEVAIVGVGTLENSVFIERGVLRAAGIAELRDAGAVGEICGRFFDAHGSECETEWADRVMSVSLEQLRKIPEVIGVISGTDRSAAVIAALRRKILKSLVIDEAGATALLAAAGSSSSPKPKA